MQLEHGAAVETVAHFHHHDKPPAEEMNIHALHAVLSKAVLDLGPHVAMIATIAFNDTRLVFQVHRQDVPS
jgi:hypothetical protein